MTLTELLVPPFSQTVQKEITQNQGDVALLLKAGNDLLEGREGAAGSDEIQVSEINLAEFVLYRKQWVALEFLSHIIKELIKTTLQADLECTSFVFDCRVPQNLFIRVRLYYATVVSILHV